MDQPRAGVQSPTQDTSSRGTFGRSHLKSSILGYGLILPSLLVFLTFYYGPAAFLAYIAFFHWDIFGQDSTFVGFKNFITLFHQPIFWQALLNTAYYVVVLVPATTLLALAMAFLLRESLNSRANGVARAFIFLPHVTPVVATSIIWIWIFNPQFGLANTLLHFLHLPALNWLESVRWALPSVMIYTLWHSVGLYTVLFLGGVGFHSPFRHRSGHHRRCPWLASVQTGFLANARPDNLLCFSPCIHQYHANLLTNLHLDWRTTWRRWWTSFLHDY